MKFAQYLQETQTPEWKKAYIDYRGLKKRITAIRKAQQGLNHHVYDSETPDEAFSLPATPRPSNADSDDFSHSLMPTNSIDLPKSFTSNVPDLFANSPLHTDQDRPKSLSPIPSGVKDRRSSVRRKTSFVLPSLKMSRGKLNGSGGSQRHANPLAALPLHELLTQLSPYEVSFFTMLDAQLDKVESFYLAREKEMLARGHMLQIQLNELHDHRKLFLKAHGRLPWATTLLSIIKSKIMTPPENASAGDKTSLKTTSSTLPTSTQPDAVQSKGAPEGCPSMDTRLASTSSGVEPTRNSTSFGKRKDPEDDLSHATTEDMSGSEKDDGERTHTLLLSSDPDSYLYAKRQLKRAVLEHYRGLELLHNYRVLNITGFRKALKKFEKVTRIPAQNQYMTEKVEKSAFASDKAVRDMMIQMEEMYAAAFFRGDRKKAIQRLRVGITSKSHHFSTFRSGLYLGLAVPALVDGLVKVFQQQTQQAIPAWGVLLYIYGVILVPVLFSVLVGINLLVWARSRINYVFIFELEVLSRLDHREYFETPSVLLASLCYAFWLSFSGMAAPVVSPTIWPLVWLAFAVIVIFDPLPLLYRSSRYWLVRNIGKQFMSGTHHVEFTDFWMGDQFCSLVFTLSNLYTFVCVYVEDFPVGLGKCATSSPGSPGWSIAFVLSAMPLFFRLVQSIKRYSDSKLITHLINAGKYGTGIISYFFYFFWRHRHGDRGSIFALWCLFNASYSIYSTSWDLLMDWSLLRLHTKYPLLRSELVYANHIYVYYFAIVTNILIRFIWVINIPQRGPNMMLRSFIAGFLEMLRRWQWNFFRLENEHLGNMDQYRVTREVPLPYAFDDSNREDDADDEDHHLRRKR